MANPGELYLIDKEGTEYAFNPDMAMHRDLYAVMRDGQEVQWDGTPDLIEMQAGRSALNEQAPSDEDIENAHEVLRRAERTRSSRGVAEAGLAAQAAKPSEPVAEHPDPALRPEPPRPQPPESFAADLLSPEHSVNQDNIQDRNQAERYGFEPKADEEREGHRIQEYGEGDVSAEPGEKDGTQPVPGDKDVEQQAEAESKPKTEGKSKTKK